MQIHPTSFLLGLGAALVVPLFSRVIRPLAIEAAVAGIGLIEEGRRRLAEQMETFEDIVAEARARREEQLLAEGNGHHVETAVEAESGRDEGDRVASRRRSNGGRRRVS